jgi:cell division protein FtsQ
MARKSSPTISQEDLYTSVDEPVRPDLDDARLVNLDVDEESPFLRGQKRVSVRRGPLPRKTTHRLLWALAALAIAGAASVASGAIYRYSEHSWRFRIDSSEDIEIAGTHNVTHAQVLEIFGGDIGRNIFFIPLAQRKAQLEQVPWVESASVMRFVPNRIKIEIHERTPVAFARVGSHISLVDAAGVLMELPLASRRKFSFPVILGMSAGEPISTRAARMKIYNDLVRQLDWGGGHYSQDLSEVDLSDPDDIKVVANDPQGAVLVHLGSSNFLERYKVYVAHLQEWRQQFNPVESVDLRYDRQIIVNPDLRGIKPAPLSPAAARVAMAAGMRPAALVTHIGNPKPASSPLRVPKGAAARKSIRFEKKRGTKARTSAPLTAKVSQHSAIAAAPSSPATQPAAGTAKPGKDSLTTKKKPSPAISRDQGAQ